MAQLAASSQISPLSQRSDPIKKLFNWNPELPRLICEYVDGDFSKPFNNVAPELRAIGGLGRARCVKKNRRRVLVNRPTRVQQVSHTTTKLTANFNITEHSKPVVCEEEKKLSMREHIERVKFAENLLDDEKNSSGAVARTKFNHDNPFNLDLAALNEFQLQRSDAEDVRRQRQFQVLRREMETKRLLTVGAEEILQEERDAKFKLPAFFDVSKSVGGEETIMSKIDEDETGDIN
jgi:hypothetical protein